MVVSVVPTSADHILVVNMSGDKLRSLGAAETVGERSDEYLTPLVGEPTPDPEPDPVEPVVTESLLAAVSEAVENGDTTLDDGLVTQSLDEILIAMIALSEDQTHGTVLMEELSRLFDADLSPGTVYPRLHELDDEGVLDVHELVQTKQYGISDEHEGRTMIEEAMHQHLAVGTFLAAAADAM